MNSLEYGRGFNPAEMEDDEAQSDLTELQDSINKLRDQCSHVYDDLSNGEMLDQLLSDAEEFYETNPPGWRELLESTQKKLIKAEDEMEVADILRNAQTSSTDYMP